MSQPLYTVFPSIQKNIWPIDRPPMECLLGHQQDDSWHVDEAGVVTAGPHITLNTGMYGIEFQLSTTTADLDPDLHIATAQVTAHEGQQILAEQPIYVREINRSFGGMYHGVRLNLIVDQMIDHVEWRVISTGAASFLIHGFKLIPRPGRIWFVEHLEREPGKWQIDPDRSGACLAPTTVQTPGYTLDPGEYRVGVKLKLPAGMTSGHLADLEAVGISAKEGQRIIVPTKPVTAEDVLARFGIPDSKMRFRLEDPHTDLQLRVRAVVAGMTIQWVRLATADESVWQHYYNLGGLDSPLGPPIGGYLPDTSSRDYVHGSQRHFANGTIYWTIEHGPCQVYGEIARIYHALGGTAGSVGFPVTRPQPLLSPTTTLLQIQYFEREGRRSAIITP